MKNSQLGLINGPGSIIQSIGGVFLRGLGVFFCLFEVMLVASVAAAILDGLHLRGGVGFHRLPLALRAVGGLLGLLLYGTLSGSDICLGVAETGLDLLIGFLSAFVEGTLQIRCSLLQGVYLVGNGYRIPPRSGSTSSSSMATGRERPGVRAFSAFSR
jgi:hypothetical protein